MLASTMQISNNNPTNPHHPHKESTRRREEPEEPRPHTHHHPLIEAGWPGVPADPSGPNSVSNHPPTNVRQMTSPRPDPRRGPNSS